MPTDIIMPQMGESIFEGTITKWLKKPGDKVQRDEPLFEISTDKVDAEIPAPASGVLQEIKVAEGSDGPGKYGRRNDACRWRSRCRYAGESLPTAPRQRSLRREKKEAAKKRPQRRPATAPRQPSPRRKTTNKPLIPARPQNRPRAQRQSFASLRHRTRRPHHQAGHHGVHRASPPRLLPRRQRPPRLHSRTPAPATSSRCHIPAISSP